MEWETDRCRTFFGPSPFRSHEADLRGSLASIWADLRGRCFKRDWEFHKIEWAFLRTATETDIAVCRLLNV